jgi:hypothetical protein
VSDYLVRPRVGKTGHCGCIGVRWFFRDAQYHGKRSHRAVESWSIARTESLRFGGIHINEASSSIVDGVPYGGLIAKRIWLRDPNMGPRDDSRTAGENRLRFVVSYEGTEGKHANIASIKQQTLIGEMFP